MGVFSVASLSGLYKYLSAFFFIMLCSASLAGANNRDSSLELPMLPANEFIVQDTANGHQDAPAGSLGESLEDIAAIPLHKHDDQIVWSLAPSLSKVSLNPIDDIRNMQVLLRFRF